MSSSFTKTLKLSKADWRKQRSKAFFYNHHIKVKVSELHINSIDSNHVNISFKQDFKSDEFSDVIKKKRMGKKLMVYG